MKFPHELQKNPYYCGPASLRMLFRYHFSDFHATQEDLADLCNTYPDGTLTQDMRKAAEHYNCELRKLTLTASKECLLNEIPLLVSYKDAPNSGHFSVISKMTKLKNFKSYMLHLKDPYYGRIRMPLDIMKQLSPIFYKLEKL